MGGDEGVWPIAGAAAPKVKPPANAAPLLRNSLRAGRLPINEHGNRRVTRLEKNGCRIETSRSICSRSAIPPDDIPTPDGPGHVVERHACEYGAHRFGHVILQHRGRVVSLLVTAKSASDATATMRRWSWSGALAVQLPKRDAPRERHRLRRKAHTVVAGLVRKRALETQRCHVLQCRLRLGRGVDRDVLHH